MMYKRVVAVILLIACVLLGGVNAQELSDLKTFQPRESFITFDYPSSWLASEQERVVALASDETALPLTLNQAFPTGQFKILLVYLTADQREQANIDGTDLDSILQSVIENSSVPIANEDFKRYQLSGRLTLRSDFKNDHNEGAVWLLQMDDDAIVLMQVITAVDEMDTLEGAIIELLRSLKLSTVSEQIYSISELDRPLRFNSPQTRLIFDYPEGWDISTPNSTTVVLDAPQVQISVQFFDYTDLSRQGIPIDDPTAVLLTLQSRSERPEAFIDTQFVSLNRQTFPYGNIQGEGFTGLSLGRDIKVGFLWVTVLMAGEVVPDDISTLAWALLLTTQFKPDPINLSQRATIPQFQFEFFYPAGWSIRQTSPLAYLLGSSPDMIDDTLENLRFANAAQLFIQYVPQEEYGIARAGTESTADVLAKFITTPSDLTTYNTPRLITLGQFEFAQVDFNNPNFSGTALLAPMLDGGAVWMQLRTPPAELGDWEPIAFAIARNARIVSVGSSGGSSLDSAVFDALDIEPTPIPTPTRRPDAPPDLGDVIREVVATPVPASVRELNFELPILASSYTTNVSQITASYPAGWLAQEIFPVSETSPDYENSIRMSNNANILLSNQTEINEGDVEIIVQYTRYAEINALGFRGDTLFDLIQSVLAVFPQDTFEPPLQFRINGDLMVLVPSTTEARQSLSIHKELADGYATVQLNVNPAELEVWLPTAIAMIQSVQLP